MSGKTYGYVRVSTKDQNEYRQYDELIAFGVKPSQIFMDKLSGKDFDRPAYQRLVHKKLCAKDLLVVKSIDRLGRNYKEILEEWKYITQKVGADVVILDMPLLDTRHANDLIGTLISDIVLQLLSFVAENERNAIRQRQAEGIASAKRRGVQFGRPVKPVPPDFMPIYEMWKDRTISPQEARERSGLSYHKFYRMVKKVEEDD